VEWQAAAAPTSSPAAQNMQNPMHMQQVSMPPMQQNWDAKGQNFNYNYAAQNRSSYAIY